MFSGSVWRFVDLDRALVLICVAHWLTIMSYVLFFAEILSFIEAGCRAEAILSLTEPPPSLLFRDGGVGGENFD